MGTLLQQYASQWQFGQTHRGQNVKGMLNSEDRRGRNTHEMKSQIWAQNHLSCLLVFDWSDLIVLLSLNLSFLWITAVAMMQINIFWGLTVPSTSTKYLVDVTTSTAKAFIWMALWITIDNHGGKFCYNPSSPLYRWESGGKKKVSELSEATGTKLASRVCRPHCQSFLRPVECCKGKEPLPPALHSHAGVIITSTEPKRWHVISLIRSSPTYSWSSEFSFHTTLFPAPDTTCAPVPLSAWTHHYLGLLHVGALAWDSRQSFSRQ